LITKGLDAEKVAMVVTDLLPAYNEVIANTFPNAVHQCCIFHLVQAFNKELITALNVHRKANFVKGARKEAHKTAFLLLKGQEKLTQTEQKTVFEFCDTYPEVAANYALKEDIRTLYATVTTPVQAYAFKDIIIDQYQDTITEPMKKGLELFVKHFDKSIAFLQKGFFLDRTNNDAERMMRAIKRIQQTHYFLRTDQTYIRKVRVVLGLQIPLAS
jgi:Transposase